jgi:hypothetical protein
VKINLHIDKLIVDDLLMGQTPVNGLTSAVEAELVRLMSQPDFSPTSIASAKKETGPAPHAQLAHGANHSGLESSIAASVVGAIQS